jgi:uracil-DNA glycosylase family protein
VREAAVSSFESWRDAARRLLAEGIAPENILWSEPQKAAAEPTLFDANPNVPDSSPESRVPSPELRVPRAFIELARAVAPHPDPQRWGLLYSVLFRLAKGDHGLMLRRGEPDLEKLRRFAEEAASMVPAAPGAGAFVPPTSDLEELRRASASCQGCDLYRHATQTVFGRGPAAARAMLVGEQPGDQEDIQGAPFVGPAGEVLDRALVEAGIPRKDVYVTNVVKHFKFVRTPKRRIHQTPGTVEIGACRPWLDAELAAIHPEMLVCLGATASKALLGAGFRLMQERGRLLKNPLAPKVLATLHPSAVLRAEDKPGQDRLYGFLLTDLKLVARELGLPAA